MNNSLGETQGVVSPEQPIEGLGPQGGESRRAVELGTCKPFRQSQPGAGQPTKTRTFKGVLGTTERRAKRQ